jgi:galactokinase
VRLFLGFGTLGEDAFGKEEVFSNFRKHFIDVNVGFLDHLIQFYGKRVHGLFLSETKYPVRLRKPQRESVLN